MKGSPMLLFGLSSIPIRRVYLASLIMQVPLWGPPRRFNIVDLMVHHSIEHPAGSRFTMIFHSVNWQAAMQTC
ncbi:hypothetical protein BDD12DRAFT_137827 [Trichophaea hybrida]|nr:hypothetical protein BDD12DRAFT_137827 [Trichophaea hybrida]